MIRKKTILCFLTAITFSPSLLFSSDYDLSVDVRYRLENDKSSMVLPGKQSSINTLRSRIGLRFIGATASAHFTLQDSRLFGDFRNGLIEAKDVWSYTSLHQAYFHFRYRKQLVQLGRFELPLGKQRLMGRSGWSLYGRSYEGLLIKSKHRIGELQMFTLSVLEYQSYLKNQHLSGLPSSQDVDNPTLHNDQLDTGIRGAYFSMKMKNRNIPALELYTLDFRTLSLDTLSVAAAHHTYTIGLRSEALYNSFSFEGETALQTGDNIFASLLSLNFKYETDIFYWLKDIGLGIEYISGDDTTTSEKSEGFSKLFGSSHRYHGFYDYSTNSAFKDNIHDGLIEFNLKANIDFFRESDMLVSFHSFTGQGSGNTIGQEIDITLNKKVSSELWFNQGLALYMPAEEKNPLLFLHFSVSAKL
tara:strand:+ start:75 stop:1322 length:1248 start_codon:yes stop_codon:yes gene_type:complete